MMLWYLQVSVPVILAVHTHYFSFRSLPFCNSNFDSDQSDPGHQVDKYYLYDSMLYYSIHLNKQLLLFLLVVEHHVPDNKCSMNSMNCKIHFYMKNFYLLAPLYRSEFRM